MIYALPAGWPSRRQSGTIALPRRNLSEPESCGADLICAGGNRTRLVYQATVHRACKPGMMKGLDDAPGRPARSIHAIGGLPDTLAPWKHLPQSGGSSEITC